MLAPWAITIRRPSGEADFILSRVDSGGNVGNKTSQITFEANERETQTGEDWVIPFQRPKANSSSCITDGIKASHFLRVMGAYMVKPKDTQFDSKMTQQFLMKRLQPKSAKFNESWQGNSIKEVSNFKKAALTFKGSVDSLMSKFVNSEDRTNDISTFIYTSVGLLIEVIPSEENLIEKNKKQKRSERQVKTTSNSPYNGHNDEKNGSSTESLQNRLNQLLKESNDNYNNENSLFTTNTYNNNLATPYYNSNSDLENSNNSNECEEISNSYKIEKYSFSNTQIPSDFSKNSPDKTFAHPLQGLSISQGHFKAFLPLSSFPRGHICLKVRGYRLEILHLIKSLPASKSINSLKKKSNTLSVRKNSLKNKVEPICLNSCLNDFSFSNQTNKLYSDSNNLKFPNSVHGNYQNNTVPTLDSNLYDKEKSKNCYKSQISQEIDDKYYSYKTEIKNNSSNNENKKYSTKNYNQLNKNSNSSSLNTDSFHHHTSQNKSKNKTYNTSNKINTNNTYNLYNPNNNHNNSKKVATTYNGNYISTDLETLLAYSYLGSVSVPIFVEPSSLKLDVDAKCQWMVIEGKMKQCISSNCLNLENDENHTPKLK